MHHEVSFDLEACGFKSYELFSRSTKVNSEICRPVAKFSMISILKKELKSMLTMLKLTIVCLAAVLSCRPEVGNISGDQKAKVVGEVQQFFENYFNAIASRGLMAEADYLDQSQDFFWVPPGYHSPISYDSVMNILRLTAPQLTSVKNSFDTLRIIVLNEKLVTYAGTLQSVMTDASGNVKSIQLIETGVVIKRDDGWKLLNGQTANR